MSSPAPTNTPPPPDSSSPPPPQSNSSPPPSADNQSPPPPNSSPPPPPPSDGGGGNSSPPPPPPSDGGGGNSSPPPPPPSDGGGGNSSGSTPPPPPSSLSSHSNSIAPPPPPSNSSPSSPNVVLFAGIAAGAALMIIVMILFFVSCAKKKKRKHDQIRDQMNYYRDHSNGSKFSAYYSGPQQNEKVYGNWQANVASTTDHVVRIPPQQGGMTIPTALHSSVLSSGEMSSDYSGYHVPLRPPPPPSFALGFTKSSFTYDELAAATGGFSNGNMVGQGGYGYVYKGILPNGKEIAVKCLKSDSGQGDREFQAEVEIISRVHHRHLVSLVGYCIGESQRTLVYEFLPNKTLEYHLHESGLPTMTWATRQRIALGSAKGLSYLHEDCHPKIIHRDIKASNILLDFTYEAKVSDFGLAKLTVDSHTHVSTRVMGTFGYLAPEYAASGKLTEKSDVFSFGVMLLELITGKRPVDSDIEDSLVDWARPLVTKAIEEGKFGDLVDPRLKGNYDLQEMTRMIASAGACIRHSARRRPKMSQIVRALEGDVPLDDLDEMAKQGHGSTFGGSTDFDMGSYGEGLMSLRKKGMDSQEGMSSEYGGATGEYDRSRSSSSNSSRESARGDGQRTSFPRLQTASKTFVVQS